MNMASPQTTLVHGWQVFIMFHCVLEVVGCVLDVCWMCFGGVEVKMWRSGSVGATMTLQPVGAWTNNNGTSIEVTWAVTMRRFNQPGVRYLTQVYIISLVNISTFDSPEVRRREWKRVRAISCIVNGVLLAGSFRSLPYYLTLIFSKQSKCWWQCIAFMG